MLTLQENKSKLLEYRESVMVYLNRWHWFLICLVLSLVSVWVYVRTTTPIYRINSTVLIRDDKKGDGILKATAFSDLNMFQETKTTDNEIEVLRSKDLIYKVLINLKQDVSYYKKQIWRDRELYGEAVPFVITTQRLSPAAYLLKFTITPNNNNTFTLETDDVRQIYKYGQLVNHEGYAFTLTKTSSLVNGKTYWFKFNNLQHMAAAYSAGKLQITPTIKDANTVLLNVTDPVIERGVDFLNRLIALYNEENNHKKNIAAINTIALIDDRLKLIGNNLTDVEDNVEAFKKANSDIETNDINNVNLAKSAEYNQALQESKLQLAQVDAIIAYMNDSQNLYKSIPSTMGLRDETLNSLISRFNNLQLERSNMLNNAEVGNRLVEDLSKQLMALHANIKENLNNIRQGIVISRDNLSSSVSRYNDKVRTAPVVERGILQRTREQGVKSTLYQYLLQKREETALSLSSVVPAAQIIDSPDAAGTAEFPKTTLLFLLGGMMGLVVPGMLIYAQDKLSIKVNDRLSVQQFTGVKVLGELCHYGDKYPVAVQSGSTTTISELFRYIRSNLKMIDPRDTNKVMLVTSCTKGEGKTFFSINLAMTLALQGKKVLLMEFDLRKPDLLQRLGMCQQKGITDFLSDDRMPLAECIQPLDRAPNVHVLGCGQASLDAGELVTNSRVPMLFNDLRDQYDYLIIDTSPIGAVADAFSLTKYADLSIYLIRYNYTNAQQLEILKDINENNKLKNLMVVFNDAKKSTRHAYAYGSYGYATERH
ncbi:capsular exopolysaccharide synthesis family protein [Mucilaginibacter yixingensis]|uniref:non-specific protein-tyrosine kinase n=1 Tax=Mucilaginibacter yixingensis TaxID=1295612 RepID=A0A2T5J9D6_9SPHI|nr:polysaccharide biosynthesis tyrosine autokinase [Mucilaginibacter yixingensis]PTQ96691.1 capsular exopolysaccharide synthesis family protein [Mucilaginibacter yixingensis]